MAILPISIKRRACVSRPNLNRSFKKNGLQLVDLRYVTLSRFTVSDLGGIFVFTKNKLSLRNMIFTLRKMNLSLRNIILSFRKVNFVLRCEFLFVGFFEVYVTYMCAHNGRQFPTLCSNQIRLFTYIYVHCMYIACSLGQF